MTARHRSRIGAPIKGYRIYNGASTEYSAIAYNEVCDDTVGNPTGVNPFSLNRLEGSGGLIDGKAYRYGNEIEFQAYPIFLYNKSIPRLTAPDPSTFLNRLLAQSGPLTPSVNLPLFIYELKDIPMMLRHAGDLLHNLKRPSGLNPIKETAAATLAYQFGWAPIIQDLNKMLDFSDKVRRRQIMLKKAHSVRGLRRRVSLGGDSQSKTVNAYVHSDLGLDIYMPFVETSSYKQWGTINWKVKDNTQIGHIPTWGEAARTAFGLNPGQLTVSIWKAIPWTWMIDWFTDISNVLQANYNSVFYTPSKACVMTHHESSWTNEVHQQDELIVSPGVWKDELKQRTVWANPTSQVQLRVPFLDAFKLSVLGSLTILKILR